MERKIQEDDQRLGNKTLFDEKSTRQFQEADQEDLSDKLAEVVHLRRKPFCERQDEEMVKIKK